MSDNKIIESKIVTYDISCGKATSIPLDKCFTKVAHRYSKITKECSYLKQQGKPTPKDGIHGYSSIEELVDFVNNILKKMPKHEHAFLKGVFKRGTSQINIVGTNDYLPIDIDDKDNPWLKSAYKTSNVIDSLRRHCVFIGRSASGTGIWGMVLVNGLGDLCKDGFNEDEKTEHKKIANNVYRKLEGLVLEDTDIAISLDDAQGAFRHIRYAAYQKTPVKINYKPTCFSYEKKEVLQEIPFTNGVIKLKREKENFVGTIYEDFNNNNSIWDLCDNVGLSRVGTSNRLLRSGGTGSTGEVKDNGAYFICNSSTYSHSHGCTPLIGYSYYYPHHFYMIAKEIQSYKILEEDLIKQGYKNSEIDLEDMSAKASATTSNEGIFKLCEPLLYRDISMRWDFYDKALIPQDLKPIYRGYLNIKNLKVEFDEEHLLEGHVSTRLEQILDLVDDKTMVALNAPTGSGKTVSIIKDFHKLRPNKSALIIVPLTGIAKQAGKNTGIYVARLSGSGLTELDFEAAKTAQLTIAVCNQAVKVLEDKLNPVDYLILDELHSYILGNAYREPVLKELAKNIEVYLQRFPDTKILGLTGTSLSLFKDLGFYMVNLYRENPPVINVIQRTDGRNSDIKIQQHQTNDVTKGEKVMYRADSVDIMHDLRRWYINDLRYKKNEVVFFTGEEQVKTGKDFIDLMENERFNNDVEIVLTSPVMDEGVSINNEDFNQLVYMDNQINWRPEVFKQLTARFRQPKDLTIYQYIKERKEQVYRNETASYEEVENEILDHIEEDGSAQTTFRVLGSLNRYKHEDGSVYRTGIAFKTSEDFFNSLTTDERNLFLKINYNIHVQKDYEYERLKMKPVKKSMPRKEADVLKAKLLNEHWQEVLSTFYSHAKKPDDKDAVLRLGESLLSFVDNEEVRSFVWRYYKYFLSVIKSYHVFTMVSTEPFSLLFNKDGTASSSSNLERKANFLKVQYTLSNIGNELGDRRLAAKYIKLLKEVDRHEGYLSIDEVLRMAKRVRIPQVDFTLVWKNSFKDIISANTSRVWDKDNHFVVKANNPAAENKYMREWLRPFKEVGTKSKEYGYKPQIVKQLKLEL